MADEIPSLADLRRSRSRRSSPNKSSTPSLFDSAPIEPLQPESALASPVSAVPMMVEDVTAADVFAEQSRSLQTPSAAGATPTPPPSAQAPAVYTVGELVRRVRSLVETSYGHVTVEGEISNWRPASSGHCYSTLKDGDAQLSIVLFRRQAQLLRFRPKDGDAVRVSGQLSIYESRGQMQLIAEFMQQTGLGALLAATQALKERLRRDGIFANARPLPTFPRCIGIVTSLHGAALRDIVKVCRRRHAAVRLLIYAASVQGSNCPAEIAAGVRWFSAHPGNADVVLVARGGGSWEDLHGFDHEEIARAIFASSVPVITGIGHAPDSTIADAAADLCAPTPSAAAELVTAAQHGIVERLDRLQRRLLSANRHELFRIRQRLGQLNIESVLRRARSTERRAQLLDDLAFRAESAITNAVRANTTRLNQLETRLRRQHVSLRLATDKHRLESLQQRLSSARTIPFVAVRTRLNHATSKLDALSPLRVLERGYALVYLNDGSPNSKLLRTATDAPEGSSITAYLAQGRLRAKVTSTE